MCQNSNGRFNNRIKFKFNYKIYIKTIKCKIVKFQKLMWRNMMKSTKSKKTSVLHYSIDFPFYLYDINGFQWVFLNSATYTTLLL